MLHILPRQLAPSITTTFITTTIPAIRTLTTSLSGSPSGPFDPVQTVGQTQCPSLDAYRYAIGILSTIIGLTLALLAIIFGYLKPKKWQKKGAASRDAEMEELRKENEEIKNSGAYTRVGAMPPPHPMMAMGPRGWW